jgi:hypothetical protein
MDAHEQLAFDSEICMGVLGRGGDFVLVRLAPIDEEATAAALAKGFVYCGVLGVKDGQAKCEPHPDAVYTMMLAGLEFARLVAERLRPEAQPKGDGVAWIASLYQLPDTRD